MSTCIWSNKPGFDSTFRRLKLQLAADAASRGERLVVAGVALDWDPAVGLRYLTDRFGRFDEISAGRNWWNSMALDRIWRTAAPDPETPQLFLYRRSIVAKPDGPTPTADSLLAHVVGYQHILDWTAAGARVAQAPNGPPGAP